MIFRSTVFLLIISLPILGHEFIPAQNKFYLNCKQSESILNQENNKCQVEHHYYRIKRGDTLGNIFRKSKKFTSQETASFLKLFARYYSPRKIRPGQVFDFISAPKAKKSPLIEQKNTYIVFNSGQEELVFKHSHKGLKAIDNSDSAANLQMKYVWLTGSIESSLNDLAQKLLIPQDNFQEILKALSFNIDFQRDIRSGDDLGLLTEIYYHKGTGLFHHYGNIIFTSLDLKNSGQYNLFRFETSNGRVYHFDEDGQSVNKSLLKTPVLGARISSTYGMRKHPILGFSRLHQGIDFAAPSGTPVMASADGKITFRGVKGGYGRVIFVQHKNNMKTVYAHLSRFSPNTRLGKYVEQGQVIGRVGMTGSATGPHLHYEVIKGRRKINPSIIKPIPSVLLKGDELNEFFSIKRTILSYLYENAYNVRLPLSAQILVDQHVSKKEQTTGISSSIDIDVNIDES